MRDKGFTLVELMVAIALGMLMMLAIYGAINSAQRSSTGIERKVVAQQDVRAALELMAMEIRMTSYNRSLENTVWANPANCNNASACPTCRGIVEATPNSLTIEMDINDSSSIGDVENEVIRYEYLSSAGDLRVTRETIRCPRNPNPQPLLGSDDLSVRSVRVINNDLGIPLFRYYNGAGVEVFPNRAFTSTATSDATITSIRQIEITLIVDTENIDPTTGQRRRLTYSTRVMPRNHAITIQ